LLDKLKQPKGTGVNLSEKRRPKCSAKKGSIKR